MLSKEYIISTANTVKSLDFKRKKVANNYKNRFDTIVGQLVMSAKVGHDIAQTSEYLIQLYVEYLNNNEAISSIENNESVSKNDSILSVYRKLEDEVLQDNQPKELYVEEEVSINDIPILLTPWKGHRVVNGMFIINDDNPFDGKNYSLNVYNVMVQPLNILVCLGGNHSQFAARYKNSGKTIITEIYNICNLYDFVEYDGIGFKQIGTNEYFQFEDILDEELFYAGVLFELARLSL